MPRHGEAVCGTTFGEAAKLFSEAERKDLEIKAIPTGTGGRGWESPFGLKL